MNDDAGAGRVPGIAMARPGPTTPASPREFADAPPRLRRSALAAAIETAAARVPGLLVLWHAAVNYVHHQSANQAGHVAFSTVVALFPFVLFLSAAASFVGEPGAAAGLVRAVADFAPPAVAEALLPPIQEVLGARNPALLTLGLLGTLWAASSGALAIRLALNRAYGVKAGLSFWAARLKVLTFTVIGTVTAVLAFGSVVVLPYLWALLDRTVGMTDGTDWIWTMARYAVASLALLALYATLYAWLPDVRQKVLTVLPGAVAGVAMWLLAASLLSWTLRSAANLTVIYGSFAGAVAVLIFLYMSAVTLILGAEINGVLHRQERAAEDADGSPPDGL